MVTDGSGKAHIKLSSSWKDGRWVCPKEEVLANQREQYHVASRMRWLSYALSPRIYPDSLLPSLGPLWGIELEHPCSCSGLRVPSVPREGLPRRLAQWPALEHSLSPSHCLHGEAQASQPRRQCSQQCQPQAQGGSLRDKNWECRAPHPEED